METYRPPEDNSSGGFFSKLKHGYSKYKLERDYNKDLEREYSKTPERYQNETFLDRLREGYEDRKRRKKDMKIMQMQLKRKMEKSLDERYRNEKKEFVANLHVGGAGRQPVRQNWANVQMKRFRPQTIGIRKPPSMVDMFGFGGGNMPAPKRINRSKSRKKVMRQSQPQWRFF